MIKWLKQAHRILGHLSLQALFTLLVFLSSLLLARNLGKADFGLYTWIWTLVQSLSLVLMQGSDDVVLRHFALLNPLDKAVMRLWINKVLWRNTVWLALFLSLFLAWEASLPYWIWPAVLLSLPVLAWLQVWQAILKVEGYVFRAQLVEKFWQPLLFVLGLALAYFGIFLGGVDLGLVLYGRLLTYVLPLLVLAYWLRRHLPWSYRSGVVSELWSKDAWQFFGHTILQNLIQRLDLLLLGYYLLPEALAAYNVGLKLAELSLIPFLALLAFAPPRYAALYARSPAELLAYFRRSTRFTAVLTLVWALVLLFLGPWFLSWYGKDFADAWPYFVWFLAVRTIHAAFGPLTYLLYLCGEAGSLTREQFKYLLVSVFLYPWALFFAGAWGLALASGLLFLLWDLRCYQLARRRLPLPWV